MITSPHRTTVHHRWALNVPEHVKLKPRWTIWIDKNHDGEWLAWLTENVAGWVIHPCFLSRKSGGGYAVVFKSHTDAVLAHMVLS